MYKFKLYLFTLLITCLYSKSFSQCVIKGTVINKETKKPVPNASLSLKKEKVGISANQSGMFEFESKCVSGDTLLVSAINYQKVEIATSTLKRENVIELTLFEKELNAVIIQQVKKKETVVLNAIEDCSTNYYVGSESMHQIGQSYNNPFPISKINGIEICKLRGSCTFRIRIYNMDTITMKPSNEITDTIIEVNHKKRKPFIDLKKYNIYIKERTFVVSIEWLLKEENVFYEKIKINGKKIMQKEYEPYLCVRNKNADNSIDNDKKVWHYTNVNNWVNINNNSTIFLISVSLEKMEK